MLRDLRIWQKVKKVLMGSDSSIEKTSTRRFRSRRVIIVAVLIIVLAVSFVFLYSLLDGHHTTIPNTRPVLVGWGGVALNEVSRAATVLLLSPLCARALLCFP